MTSTCSQTPAGRWERDRRATWSKPCSVYRGDSPPLFETHAVSGEHLGSVLVLDLDDSGRLDPRLAVHLNGNSLVAQDGDLHCSTLIRAGRAHVAFTSCNKVCRFFHIVWWVRFLTCAMRWCCSLMTLDTAICMLPKTATTSRILSSNEGAQKICTAQWRQSDKCPENFSHTYVICGKTLYEPHIYNAL